MNYRTFAACLFGAGLSVSASAVVIIDQDFESFSAGTELVIAPTGDGATTNGRWWASTNTSTVPPTIVSSADSPVRSGTQSLQIGQSSPGTHTFAASDLGTAATGVISHEFYFNRETGSGFTFSAVENTRWYSAGMPVGYVLADGRLGIRDHVLNTWVIVSTGLAADTWYGVKMDIDMDAKLIDVSLDSGSGYVNVGNDIAYTGDPGAINSTHFSPASGTFYVDDMKMALVPEPGAMGLALAGIGLVGFRRRKPNCG